MASARILTVAALALAGGCAKDCHSVSDVPATQSQAAALKEAKSRSAKYCSASNARCRYHIVEADDGTVLIHTGFIYFQPEFGGCVQAGDSIEDARYSSAGQFIRIEPQ